MSGNFGWPQPVPAPQSRWRPHPATQPGPFDTAASIERIRQQQAQQAQFTPDQVLDATADHQFKENTRDGLEAYRQFNGPGPNVVGVTGPTLGEGDAFRAPGAPTMAEAQEQQANAEALKNWEDFKWNAQMAGSVLWQRAQHEYKKGKRQKDELDSMSAGVGFDPTATMPQAPEAPTDPQASEQEKAAKEFEAKQNRATEVAHNEAFPTGTHPNPVAPVMEKPEDMLAPKEGFTDGTTDRRKAAAETRRRGTRKQENRWADPTELGPLPGEETLPPSVTRWSSQNAASNGMARLRQAYEIERDSSTSGETFEDWLVRKGVTPDLKPEEADAKLNEILADNVVNFGHDPLDPGQRKDPRIDTEDDTVLQGRRGVADDTPLDLMTDEQKAKIGRDPSGAPRTARGGRYVWDQTADSDPLRDGEGGFVPRGVAQDRLAEAQKMAEAGNYRGAAAILGIDHMAYGDNVPTLAGDVRAELQRHERMTKAGYVAENVAGGGVRYKAGPVMQAKVDKNKRNMSMRTMTSRYAKEMKDSGVGAAQMREAYDSAYNKAVSDGSDNPHRDAMASLNDRYLEDMRLRRTQDQKLAYNQSQDQYARSVRFGLPKSVVAGLDTVGNAQTVQDKANALMVLHAQQPGMGWDRMAGMLIRGDLDARALNNWIAGTAGQPSPFQKHQANLQRVSSGEVSDTTFAEMGALAATEAGQAGTDAQRQVILRRYTQPVSTRIVNKPTQPTPAEMNFVRQATAGMNYDDFCEHTGLDPKSPASRKKYETITGNAVGFRMADIWSGVGGAIGWLAGGGGPANPGTAQAAPPGK